jgi:class 3 adenylate cyclase/tetratricopeptide (TPR) repeat protein
LSDLYPMMDAHLQAELKKLRHALIGLEAQRGLLGEAVIEPALQSLQEKIAALEAQLDLEQPHSLPALPTQAAEERRILTVLFMDIVGSTSLAGSLDPEDYRELVSSIHDMAGKVVISNHGSVLQYLGDGLLAAFGVMQVSEQDPENALRAGLGIQTGCAALQTSQPVQLRVGIHTGLVLLGELALEAHQEFTATGEVMNLAARLQSLAPPGGVLISHETYRYVRNLFDVTAQLPVQVKGKSDPIQTYLVLRPRPTAFRNVTRGVAGIDTHTFGREQELGQIHRLYQETLNKNKSCWVQMVGSPGIGKSRLVTEMEDFLESQSEKLWLLKGRAFQGDERQAYALVRRFWFNRLHIAEDIPLDEAEARWVKGIQELALVGESHSDDLSGEETAHALGLLVGLPFAGSPYLAGRRQDPIQVKGRAYVITHSILQALRRVQPVIILLEDLHWCDAASWDYLVETLLEDKAAQLPSEGSSQLQGIFILATARPEWSPPQKLISHASYTSIELKPLTQSACQDFVNELLQDVQAVPEDVPQLIIQRSEGVPFFIEELINWLLDRGVIDHQQQPWHFIPGRWQADPLPATLQHLLLARLGAIPAPEQTTLKYGAVFGRHFWESGVEAMGVPDSHALLVQSQGRGFVTFQPDSAFASEREWSFYHNLLRETTYESILKRERRKLHQTAAQWLEAQARQANRLDEFAGLLAEHYDFGGLEEKASYLYLLAGQRAKDRFALQEACRLLNRALELTLPSDQEGRWKILLLRSSVLGMLGETEANQVDIAALLSLARTTGNEQWLAEAYHRQGHLLKNTGDIRGSVQAYKQGRLAAQSLGDQATEALTLSLMVVSLDLLGEMSLAAQTADQAMSLLPSVDDEIIQAMVLTNLANYYGATGDHIRAMQILEQQIEITGRLSNLYGESIGLANLGYETMILGRYDRSLHLFTQSIARSESIGARHQTAFTRLNLALALWRLNRLPEARQTLQKVLLELAATGDTFGQGVSHTYLGLVLEKEGSLEAAKQEYFAASQILRELGTVGNLNDALAGLARIALALDLPTEAQRHCQEIWEYLRQSSGEGMELPLLAYLTCYTIFDRLGETEQAHHILELGIFNLNENAARISDQEWKKSFLENIPEHRLIRAAWEEVQNNH